MNPKLFNKQHRAVAVFLAVSFCLSASDGGCRRVRNSEEPVRPATEVRQATYLIEKLKDRDVTAINMLTARADIFAETEGQSVNAHANIIWIRDSVLWINVRKFGIEAARALITKDSVFLINRLDKTYSVKGLESLQLQYSLPAGFPLLQHLVLASAWFFPDITLNSDLKDQFHRLSGSNSRATAEYKVEEGSFYLRTQTFVQQRDARVLSTGFDVYKKLPGAGAFPYLRRIEAYSPETGAIQLRLELSDVQINTPKNYRFEIPEHYERIE